MARKTHTARHGQLRRSSSIGNAAKVALSAMLAVVISGIAVAAYAVMDLGNRVHTVELASGPNVKLAKNTIDGAINVLIVGSDTRQGQQINDGEQGQLNDVNMLLHVSKDHTRATVVSFPRDLMLPVPSCPGPKGEPDYYPAMSEQQLNSTLQYGLPCVVKTIEALTGAKIPYAGMITFDGVINMSKAVGGVDVCLRQPIQDPKTDLDLPAGDVTLVGRDALQFLRTRHGVGDGGDTSRISNQQVFLSALMRKVKSGSTLSDPVKVYGMAKAAVENMTLSSNMASVGFMQAVAGLVKDIDLDNITFVQYPTYQHPYEESRLVADSVNGELLMKKVLSDEPFEVAKEGIASTDSKPGDNGDSNGDNNGADNGQNTGNGTGGAPANGNGSGNGNDNKLPDAITGQKASKVTCSAGRVVY